VDDIAEQAGVAPVTVYTSVGGKRGILRALVDVWTTSPIRNKAAARIAVETDPETILKDVAVTMRRMREEFADIIYAMHDAAPFDASVADALAIATERYRGSCRMVATRLHTLDGLKSGVAIERAADLLWFYFGYWSWFTLHSENGWSYKTAEKWLFQAAKEALLNEVDV
jgi:AcrR family transcriptional regulator